MHIVKEGPPINAFEPSAAVLRYGKMKVRRSKQRPRKKYITRKTANKDCFVEEFFSGVLDFDPEDDPEDDGGEHS